MVSKIEATFLQKREWRVRHTPGLHITNVCFIMPLSHIIGVDDAPFSRETDEKIRVVGAAYAGKRLEGILSTFIKQDGDDATHVLSSMIGSSKFADHLQVVILQGIALGGFNVVDIRALHESLGVPVLVVCRHQPDLTRIRKALLHHVENGVRKWSLIERIPPMEPVSGIFVQRVGLSGEEVRQVVEQTACHGNMPEPVRTAHLVAGGIQAGESGPRV